MRSYRNHQPAMQMHVIWMVTLFTILTVLLSLVLAQPAH